MLISLSQLRLLMQTSTTSMTSVPKPLKYLKNSYNDMKNAHKRIRRRDVKRQFAEVLSVLSMAGATPGSKECLRYCTDGEVTNPGEWGHEYVRQLEAEIVDEWTNAPVKDEDRIRTQLTPLVNGIIKFDMKHNAEIPGCDLCLEIDQLNFLNESLDNTNFERVCRYLESCAAYSEDIERRQILQTVVDHYLRFQEYCKAMLVALQLGDSDLVHKCLTTCPDDLMRKQLSFILVRQRENPLKKDYEGGDAKDIEAILSNSHVNNHYHLLARELDILEPKHPDDIYKTWLETNTLRRAEYDSARANLAATFVSGFVHAGFGQDKLMANTADCWVYKNKEHGMLSATASLGLIHMWDVDGGLVPIDKYLYTNDHNIKAGALLAIGLVNCGVRNECDPALALLSDYVYSENITLRIGAVLGLGLAYAGSQRSDVTELLTGVLVDEASTMEIVSLGAIAIGLINVGSADAEASSTLLQRLIELTPQKLSSTYSRFLPLALGMIYMGCRDIIDAPSAALEVLPDPYKLAAQTMLEAMLSSLLKCSMIYHNLQDSKIFHWSQVCAYAGTGDVLIVQGLLRICSEPANGEGVPVTPVNSPTSCCCDQRSRIVEFSEKRTKEKLEEKHAGSKDIGSTQAIATLGVAAVGLGEGKEDSRIFGQIGRYGPTAARRAMPLALGLSFLSNPDLSVLDVLNKYSHDNDSDVANNAIFALGLVGAGTNNARLATMLRQLACYHAKNPTHLFLVRISQGLVHLGKGTLSISPLRYASKVLDKVALAGLLVVLVAFLDCQNLILSKSHYLMYCLALAMEPRWLVTLDENLQSLPVSVRVGKAVDIVGKAGNPKSISGGYVHTTPTLLSSGERAELALDEYEALSSVLEGFVILREKSNVS
ncbi:26S proteasome non-ATPase regulatory subunit 2-like [Bombus vosnesenskii]|uniref:26S proteasome non-ATPase regulatory subunit 2 n=2 Tax=Pyrobombus TaxID=144703 RepID=A0A6J3LAU4_9HYME|nr:26S proteasome non-ATPase regulatory subunit 2-like [Bombus impatiens]XP_033361049.1 26S proteasome non-ATPase regulatory subunit 2-like [Bombus vosnesenskii]